MSFPDDGLTRDGFLGGQITVCQPKSGYRAATDPVFLAASVPAERGQTVLELGCGAGVASLCLGARVPGLELTGVELQADYAELAVRNGRDNGIAFDVVNADIRTLPMAIRSRTFDHVIVNPPYFEQFRGTGASETGRDTAMHEETSLADWIDTGIRRLCPGGVLSVIHLAGRLPALLAECDARVGNLAIKPLSPRTGRPAGRVILRARKGSKGPGLLHAPLVIHRGASHLRDGESYTRIVEGILRGGQPLPF